MIETFKASRRAAVPIVAIETFDPQQTIRTIAKSLNGTAPPIMSWDIIRGLAALNQQAVGPVAEICQDQDPAIATGNPAEMLSKIVRLPESSIVFMLNAHRYVDPKIDGSQGVAQGIWNLRDPYKGKGATLVLLSPAITLPDELKQDVMVIAEPLPTFKEIEEVIKSVTKDAGMEAPADIEKIGDTLVGLSAFAAEQTLATCLEKKGKKLTINRKNLWERKCKAIEQTPGLSIWRGGETFDDIGGCENAKSFLKKILTGKKAPRSIVFIDEIEKQSAGISGDSSGTSQDQLGVILKEMQDNRTPGMIFIGPPGAAKSVLAKAAGNVANIPTIAFDLGAMKDKFVGESGAKTRQAFKVINAVSQGQSLFIATCNAIASLPPELRRRFRLGTFFFDLPTKEERKLIWDIHIKKLGLTPEQCDEVNDEDWTGAEIEACCDIADRLGGILSEAAKFIVPVAKSAADKLESLRKQSSGKYISASYSGMYQMDPTSMLHESYRAIKEGGE